MQDIRDKYPPWLEKHQPSIPAEEFGRYVQQYESIQTVCLQYETDAADFSKLVELIQQACRVVKPCKTQWICTSA